MNLCGGATTCFGETSEITGAEEVLLEAQQARANAKLAGVNAETLSKVDQMITSGIELLDVVRIGNGVHNKKYAITIIDEVYGYLEDAIDLLAEGG
mgnify:CR=1 FL=1